MTRLTALAALTLVPGFAMMQVDSRIVPVRARDAQLWSRTYSVLAGFEDVLAAATGGPASARLATTHGAEPEDVRWLINFVLNYGPTGISADRLLVRYPHYARQPVEDDLRRLAGLGWIEAHEAAGSFRWTPQTEALIAEYFVIEAARDTAVPVAARPHLGTVVDVLDTVTETAAGVNDGEINDSLRWRLNAPREPEASPVVVRARQRFRDLIAFVNDNAHYRLDRLARTTDFPIDSVGPLEKELFSAMRGGRVYERERCAAQRNWRQTEATCDAAFATLIDADLIETASDSALRQTPRGAAYSDAAEDDTDRRLYMMWIGVTSDAFDAYRSALDALEAITEEMETP